MVRQGSVRVKSPGKTAAAFHKGARANQEEGWRIVPGSQPAL